MRKEAKKQMRDLERAGYVLIPGGSGHWRVTKDGAFFGTVCGSPSDKRSLKNQLTRLRRRGVEI